MGKKPVSVEVRLSKPRSEGQVYAQRKVPTLTKEQRNELGEGYRKARLTNSTLDKVVKKGRLSAAEAERLKDPAIAMSEILYVFTDEKELLFSVLLYLCRNGLLKLSPKIETPWNFIKKFMRAADDSQAWEIFKRLENPFTYAERPGGMRGYVRAIRRSLSSRERSPEELTATIETFGAEYEERRYAAAQKPVATSPSGEYTLADAAQLLSIPQRTLYRWCERGEVDAIKVAYVRKLTPKGMKQAERLGVARRLRKVLMEKLIAGGRTESASKKLIQRGSANGETFIDIATRVQAKSAGRGTPFVD
jgi:helix-turn-helix protein